MAALPPIANADENPITPTSFTLFRQINTRPAHATYIVSLEFLTRSARGPMIALLCKIEFSILRKRQNTCTCAFQGD
jgi:hypothetical protein